MYDVYRQSQLCVDGADREAGRHRDGLIPQYGGII